MNPIEKQRRGVRKTGFVVDQKGTKAAAKAIYLAGWERFGRGDPVVPWAKVGEVVRQHYRAVALAALTAAGHVVVDGTGIAGGDPPGVEVGVMRVKALYTPAFGLYGPVLALYDLGLSAQGDEAITLRDQLGLRPDPTGAWVGEFNVTFEAADGASEGRLASGD